MSQSHTHILVQSATHTSQLIHIHTHKVTSVWNFTSCTCLDLVTLTPSARATANSTPYSVAFRSYAYLRCEIWWILTILVTDNSKQNVPMVILVVICEHPQFACSWRPKDNSSASTLPGSVLAFRRRWTRRTCSFQRTIHSQHGRQKQTVGFLLPAMTSAPQFQSRN